MHFFKYISWRKFDRENAPWHCEFASGGYHTFASDNAFACGPTGAIFALIMHKQTVSLTVVSKLDKHYFSLRNLDFYKC